MGKIYMAKKGDACVIMDAKIVPVESELREPLENLGMEFGVYHDWAFTGGKGYFAVAKSKADFLTKAFDIWFGKATKSS